MNYFECATLKSVCLTDQKTTNLSHLIRNDIQFVLIHRDVCLANADRLQ